MNFLKNKGKESPDIRGLSDHQPHGSPSAPPVAEVTIPGSYESPQQAYSPSVTIYSDPSVDSMYQQHSQAPPPSLATSSIPYLYDDAASSYEPPQQVRESEGPNLSIFAGGNKNEEGQQTIGEVEVGSSSNEVVSPILGSNMGSTVITAGNNENRGGTQNVGGVKIGNVRR